MEQFQLQLTPSYHVYPVRELTAEIRNLLDRQLGEIRVSGEVSGAKLAPSGHWYFTLKDGDAQIRCALFRMNARWLKCKPRDGIQVIARGRLDLYDSRGELQFIVEHLEPRGEGVLQMAFEQLKKKLAEEGLFDSSRKRPIPKLPRRIGIVTSPSGAVIQDMLNILDRRFPGLWIRVCPALVQGDGSVEQVVRGLRYFSEIEWADVVIVARGGGSLEDLWTFNEEAVARAIAASKVPVISAIGHETDFTIADFVADLRAPTPSAAAEMVICTRDSLLESVEGCRRRLEQMLRYRLSVCARRLHEQGVDRAVTLLHRRIARLAQRVDENERCVAEQTRRILRERSDALRALDTRLRHTDLRLRFAEVRRRVEALEARSGGAMARALQLSVERMRALESRFAQADVRMRLADRRHRLEALDSATQNAVRRTLLLRAERLRLASARLEQLSPLRVLERGYSIVQDAGGHVVKSAADAPAGTALRIRLSQGAIAATSEGAAVETPEQ